MTKVASPTRAVTKEAALIFGNNFAYALNFRDTAMVVAAFDHDALVDAVMDGLEGSAKNLASLRGGVEDGMRMAVPGLVGQLLEAVSQGGEYTFLHLLTRENGFNAIFRLLTDDGLDYIEISLVPASTGEARVADLYSFAHGQSLSEVSRSIVIPPGFDLSRDTEESREQYIQQLSTVGTARKEIAALMDANRYREVIERIDALPSDWRDETPFPVYKLQSAIKLGGSQYDEVLLEAERGAADDPTIDLILFDNYLIRQDYDRAWASIDRLDTRVEGDPYLNVVRSLMAYLRGDFEMAKRLAQTALEQEPNLLDAHNQLLIVSVAMRDFDGAVAALTRMEGEYGFEANLEVLTTEPVYAEFSQSEPFKAWVDARARPNGPTPENNADDVAIE